MPRYTINTHHDGHQWIATLNDYDGTPFDSPNRLPNRFVMGKAGNEVDAIVDLLTEDWADQMAEGDCVEPCREVNS